MLGRKTVAGIMLGQGVWGAVSFDVAYKYIAQDSMRAIYAGRNVGLLVRSQTDILHRDLMSFVEAALCSDGRIVDGLELLIDLSKPDSDLVYLELLETACAAAGGESQEDGRLPEIAVKLDWDTMELECGENGEVFDLATEKHEFLIVRDTKDKPVHFSSYRALCAFLPDATVKFADFANGGLVTTDGGGLVRWRQTDRHSCLVAVVCPGDIGLPTDSLRLAEFKERWQTAVQTRAETGGEYRTEQVWRLARICMWKLCRSNKNTWPIWMENGGEERLAKTSLGDLGQLGSPDTVYGRISKQMVAFVIYQHELVAIGQTDETIDEIEEDKEISRKRNRTPSPAYF